MSESSETNGSKVDDLPVLPFLLVHTKFIESLRENFPKNNFEGLSNTHSLLITRDKENKKIVLDQCLREYQARELIVAAKGNVQYHIIQKYVEFVVQAAQAELCNVVTPIQVLGDVFEILPIAKCEIFFKIVEKEVATWRSSTFYTSIKNQLLRICNDLLRRLSRTQNTVFCGRILRFLASFFPFSERSGLNVISEFNLDNTTVFTKEKENSSEKNVDEKKDESEAEVTAPVVDTTTAAAKEDVNAETEVKEKTEKVKDNETEEKKGDKSDEVEAMEIELIVEEKEKMEVEKKEDEKESRASREFKLYCNFWQLQDYFRDPTQCYDKDEWEQFCSITAEIITCFNKKKLDTRASKKEPVMKESADSFVEEYFPKYLTNQNLLSLQLNDSNFRRYVLMQYLILFQYLQTSVKFKTESQVLSTDNGKWIDDQRKKIYKLLEETPPNGKVFCSSAKSILKREEIWIRWKNEGCVSLVIPSPPPPSGDTADESTKTSTSTLNPRKRKRPLGDQMKNEAKYGKINLGNKGLTKLWNINTDNLGACKDQERNFLPSLMQFFGDPIEEMKPGSGVEAEYKKVNQGQWGWRALRLMSRRSQHFFLIGNSQINKLPEYLEHMMEKMARDFGIDMEGPAPEEMDTNNGESNGAKAMNMKLTDEQIASLAVKLADVCDKLLPKLGLPDEKVEEIKSFESNQEKCLKLLSSWVEQEADGASPDEIKYILESLKMSELIDGVF